MGIIACKQKINVVNINKVVIKNDDDGIPNAAHKQRG